MEKLRANVRRKDGTKAKPVTKSEIGRSAMSKAFNEARNRRKEGDTIEKKEYSSGEREKRTDGIAPVECPINSKYGDLFKIRTSKIIVRDRTNLIK